MNVPTLVIEAGMKNGLALHENRVVVDAAEKQLVCGKTKVAKNL